MDGGTGDEAVMREENGTTLLSVPLHYYSLFLEMSPK